MANIRRSLLSALLVLGVTATVGFAADVSVIIKTWKIPQASQYPHDPMVHSDGSIWYAARFSSTLGRFDPKTEQWKEFVTDIPNSGPHGLKEDKDGNIWFTAVNANPTYIGKLNPKTGEFTEYPVRFEDRVPCPPLCLPTGEPQGSSPKGAHSLSLDQKGNIWFSMFGGGMIGRLVPSTGKITISRPTVPVGPYDVQIDSKGIPWFTLVRTNKAVIARVNPETMAVRTYSAPWPDARPRRIQITADDVIWYTDHVRGSIGRFDPKTEKFDEWPSPGGEWTRPYGMVAVGDVIWYSETWMDPSMLVRFDTKTKELQSWPVPGCFDGAYYMVHDKDKNIWFTCHDTNRLGKAEITEGGVTRTSTASSAPGSRD